MHSSQIATYFFNLTIPSRIFLFSHLMSNVTTTSVVRENKEEHEWVSV